jgi:hypothetical protein
MINWSPLNVKDAHQHLNIKIGSESTYDWHKKQKSIACHISFSNFGLNGALITGLN